ncbi:hypothetical protein Q7P36_002787 [Cladosporium allicinum]
MFTPPTRRDFGVLPAVALRLGLFDAKGVVDEVREHFIRGDGGLNQAMAFKDSYTPTFNMVGVAGAITAQIALTALSLPYLDDTHWTARASFVVGLVAGSLSVFCSCVLQSKMSAPHTAHTVRRWLTRTREKLRIMGLAALRDDMRNPNIEKLTAMKWEIYRFNKSFNEKAYRPSLSAALIITAPLQLLNFALGSLLTGFGIYFGFVYSAKLPTIGDHHSALAVLVVYIASAASGLLLFYLPILIKLVATMRDQKDGGDVSDLMDQVAIADQSVERAEAAAKQDGVLSALTRIANIQDEQLRIQKDFQAFLEARFDPPSSHPPSPHPPSPHPPSSRSPSSSSPSS